MQTQIVKMINDFEHGRPSRRQLIGHLTGMFAASLGATLAFADPQPERAATNPVESAPTFDATDLNHIALTVTDLQRSERWSQKHAWVETDGTRRLRLPPAKAGWHSSSARTPGLNHYCYSVAN